MGPRKDYSHYRNTANNKLTVTLWNKKHKYSVDSHSKQENMSFLS